MNMTRWYLGVALVVTSIVGNFSAYAEEEARDMEEVVVTSRRRDESQQDVPLSVTAFNSERIEQLKPTTLRDFDSLAPNVFIGMNAAGPSNGQIFIRGIGYGGAEKTQSPQVGLIVDGIQLGSNTGQLIDAFDIESIEVNRGPQGVLFGKNTIGGNIVVNRVKPQFNEFGLNTSAEFGNYDSEVFKARFNIPLIDDQLALKVGAISRDREGYYDNLTLGQTAGDVDFQSLTVALRWAPSDNFEMIATYDNIDDTSQISPQDPRFDGDDPFQNRANKEEPTIYEVDQFGIRATWDINDNLTLYSITGYHDSYDSVNQDFDGGPSIGPGSTPFAQLHTLRQQGFDVFSQELRLNGSLGEDLDFMVGYYYYDSEQDFYQGTNQFFQLALGLPAGVPCAAIIPGTRNNGAFCQLPNARSTQFATEDVESSAIFASLTWRATDAIEVALGVRRIDEEKAGFNSYFDHSTGLFDAEDTIDEFDFSDYPTRVGTTYSIEDEWDDTIFTASASYNISNDNNVYVNYSEGFRSGGFSIRSAGDPSEAPYEPEYADQIEIGSKNEFFDGRLQLNLAWFELTQENEQIQNIIVLPADRIPGTTTLINNANKSTYDGWELEGRWLINDNLTLTFNYGSMDLEEEDFELPCQFVDGCISSIPGQPNDPVDTLRRLSGDDENRAPEETWSVNLAYVNELGKGTLFSNVGVKYAGRQLLVNTGAGIDNRTYQDGYHLVDARVAYELPLENESYLTISLYGKNLNDEEYREQVLFLGGGTEILPSGGPNSGFQGWGAPRTYALELKYSM